MRQFSSLSAGLLLALLLFPAVASACLWVHGSTIDGDSKSYSPVQVAVLMRAMTGTPAEKLKALQRSFPGAPAGREQEAVENILSGNVPAAIQLLHNIEQESPGQYSTAVNLGTAHELAGDNNNALKWINEGMRRNPKSHYGTEWLHALVLETKLRLEKDPGYLKTNHVISLPREIQCQDRDQNRRSRT